MLLVHLPFCCSCLEHFSKRFGTGESRGRWRSPVAIAAAAPHFLWANATMCFFPRGSADAGNPRTISVYVAASLKIFFSSSTEQNVFRIAVGCGLPLTAACSTYLHSR